MEPLDNQDDSDAYPRETGDTDQFNQKLIPLKINSYLGQSLIWSEYVRAFQVSISPHMLYCNDLINDFCPAGFSIDSGMALLRQGELTIVSGAPRGGYSGQVTFLKADPRVKTNLSVEFVLSGPGLASSFGYDVAVVDLNADG